MPESKFTSDQALAVAAACAAQQVDYLFIGKSGAILLGYPTTTQDVDIFLPKDRANAARMIRALKAIGFKVSRAIQKKILEGADVVQLKGGPFDLNLIHAPDGISSFSEAKKRSVLQDGFPRRQPARHHCQQEGQQPGKRSARPGVAGRVPPGVRKAAYPADGDGCGKGFAQDGNGQNWR